MPRARVLQSFVAILGSLTIMVLTAGSIAGASVDASGIFLEGRLFNSGGNGVSNLAVADLNGDGKLDVVVANTCVSGSLCGGGVAGSIGVLMGNSDGTYQPAAIYYSYATVVSSVALTDVNGDGKPDVLVGGTCTSGVCATQAVISVLLGNGDGSFRQGGYFASAFGAGGLAVGDLNGDGKADVVSAGGSLGVMLGNGDGTFQPQVIYDSGGSYPNDVVIADVNGDGKPDLVVSNQNVALLLADGGVSVLLGNGDGTFQTAVSYDAGAMDSYSVAVADLNGDHHPDIVVTTFYAANAYNNDHVDGSVGVLLNNGDGGFGPVVNYYSGGGQTYGVAVADLNGDGKLDLLVANAAVGRETGGYDNALGVLLGNGDGTFQLATSYATGGTGAYSAVVADVNGDGKADVLMTEQYAGPSGPAAVGVLLGNNDGSFRAPVIYASGTYADNTIAVVDVNGDGKLDLVIAAKGVGCTNCVVGGVGVMLGNGNGTFESPVAYGTGTTNPSYSVAAADVNGDGKPDVVAASSCISNVSCVSSVAVLLNNGDGTFKAAVNYATNGQAAHAVAIGDVNGDGKPDIVVANSCASGDLYCTSGTVGVLLGNGDGTFRPIVNYSTGGQLPTAIALGDLNNDGKLDIAVSNYQTTNSDYTGRIAILLGHGDGTFQPAVTYISGGVANNSVTIADLNADGKLDLVAVNQGVTTGPSTGTVGVLLGNGDGTFETATVTLTTRLSIDYFAQVAVADFNGDGKLDVACAASDFLLLGNGDGTFQPVLPLGFEGTGIATGDFNGDGRPDLAVGGVAVLLNISSGFRENDSATLVSSANPAAYNQKVTFTATVVPQGLGTPTGTVTFKDGVTTIGTASLTSGSAMLSSALALGAHSITVLYGGDSNFQPNTSAVLSQTINKAITTTALASSANPSYLGQSVTFRASVNLSSAEPLLAL
jgi:Big-like domain-containing protein/VCBS repeat protein/FG-GAP repeat protein